MHNRKHNAGFTMLEVLITLVILSIGLLGLAGLQATGLKNNRYAYMTTQAAQLAYDMSDRMRANMAGVDGGSYNTLEGDPTDTDCESAECSSANMAQYDFFTWRTDLASTLPYGYGEVSVAAGIATITVMWREDGIGIGTNCSGDNSVDLKCFQVELEL